MTTLEGTGRFTLQDSNGQTLMPITGPIELRNFRVSTTDRRQQVLFFAPNPNQITKGPTGIPVGRGLFQQPQGFQVAFGDDTASAAGEEGEVELYVSDPTDGKTRSVLRTSTLQARMPAAIIAELLDGGTLTGYPGDPRQHQPLQFGMPGPLNAGAQIRVALIPDSAGDTVESEESWLKLPCIEEDIQTGFTRPAIYGILDGVHNDVSGIPEFGRRGATETADDRVMAGAGASVDVWMKQVPTGFRYYLGWGGPMTVPVAMPGQRIAFEPAFDASPTGSTLESEDAHVVQVPITEYSKATGKATYKMLRQSNTVALDKVNFNTTVDRPAHGGEFATAFYYDTPLETFATLGWPANMGGGPCYILLDKA